MALDTLKGIRVVDLTMWAFVPAAGCVLAHWGADVIKVENPHSPDPMRVFGGTLRPGEASSQFKHYNRGKRGIGLNLASDEGRELLYRLVERSDVFLTSYLTATRRKLGVDVDDIRRRNPNIIFAKGTGQGPVGPESERGGYDGASWWARGSLSNSAMQASGAQRPVAMVGHGDGMSGLSLAGGICAGLVKRAITGTATVIDGSLLGTAIWFNGPQIIGAKGSAAPTRVASDETHHVIPAVQSNQYKTRDGRWISIHQLTDPDDLFADLVEHLGRADLLEDSRFATTVRRRRYNAELVDILDGIFAARDLAEWRQVLSTTKGVWAVVQTAMEVHGDPQTIANGFVRDVEYPGGPLSVPVPPVLFDEDAGDPGRAPDFCEHTDEVLREIGCDAAELAAYRAAGAIG
jgi:crotonobetainyl-CoA:carnitine CoA-transferase CaiB-like acyl-CoA transferase